MEQILDTIYDEISKATGKEIVTKTRQQIQTEINRLKVIKTELQYLKVLNEKAEVAKQSALYQIFNLQKATNKGLKLRITDNISDDSWMRVAKLISEAYKLTSTILSELGMHDTVTTTLYYQDPQFGMQRIENFEFTEDMIAYEFRGKHSGRAAYMRLKFNEQVIKQLINEQNDIQKKFNKDVSEHYNNFKELLIPKRGKWHPNEGVVAEAFERHWENIHSQAPNFIPDVLSKAQVWALYILSSDNAPYYTGADTQSAQVKAINASIISNVNTVLQTLESLLLLFDNFISPSQISELAQQYKLAFEKRKDKTTISATMERYMTKTVSKEVQKIFKSTDLNKI